MPTRCSRRLPPACITEWVRRSNRRGRRFSAWGARAAIHIDGDSHLLIGRPFARLRGGISAMATGERERPRSATAWPNDCSTTRAVPPPRGASRRPRYASSSSCRFPNATPSLPRSVLLPNSRFSRARSRRPTTSPPAQVRSSRPADAPRPARSRMRTSPQWRLGIHRSREQRGAGADAGKGNGLAGRWTRRLEAIEETHGGPSAPPWLPVSVLGPDQELWSIG